MIAGILAPIVGRLKCQRGESWHEATTRAQGMPWWGAVRGRPHLCRGYWCFRGVP